MTPSPDLGRALFGVWTYYLFQGLMKQAEETVREIVALAEHAEDHGVRIMAHLAAAQTYLWMGRWVECLHHAETVYSLYDPAQHATYITQYAQNPKFTALQAAFWAQWALGQPETSLKLVMDAIDEARRLNHEFTFVMAYLCLPLLHCYQRDVAMLAQTIDVLCDRAERAGNPFYIGLARVIDGWLKVASSRREDGVQQIVEQRRAMQLCGSRLAEPFVVTVLADAHLRMGQYVRGLEVLDETYETFLSNAHLNCLPEHLRLRGELLLGLGEHERAETCFRQAVEAARRESARTCELRAALSLSRLLRETGRGADGRAVLAPIYGAFREGLETADLKEAAELLRVL
jgi:tetratricopeptide (TPR) repeat protein